MSEIFTKVVLAIAANSGGNLDEDRRTADFLQNPSRVSLAERDDESRPDGYLVLKNRDKVTVKDGGEEGIHWADIALSCEYKWEDDEDYIENIVIRSCLWSLEQVMRDDPCRRTSFGMTIEDSTARVWFCRRSSVFVSETFDFIDEPENLVKLFAAFAFADQKSLGFDPTIQPVTGNGRQFIITVHPDNDKQNPRRFRTTQLLSSSGVESLWGRGTRVFEAIEIDGNGESNGPHVVLKDTWIYSDRIREGNTLALLHAAANDEDRQLVEKFFLSTVCHGDVWTELDVLDDTANALMRGLNISPDYDSLFKRNPYSQSHEPPHKVHYRIVFKEKGIPLYRIKSLPDVMTVFIDIVSALRLLRKLGWVHRDVSIGNILSCGGHAKLADLEFAKRMGDSESDEMRTGTLDFMSIEVAAQGFLFLPSRGEFSLTDFKAYIRAREQDGGTAPKYIPFSYNHLHDLESLWWVAVWVVFFNRFSKGTPSPDRPSLAFEDASRQLKLAQTLFPLALESTTRQNVFQKDEDFLKKCEWLPSNKKAICLLLGFLRQLLISNYKIVEAKHPSSVNPDSPNNGIYDGFTEGFSISKTDCHGLVLDFIPDIYEKLSKVESSKRSRSESTNDIGGSQKSQKI